MAIVITLAVTHLAAGIAGFVYGKKRGAEVGAKIAGAADAVKKAAS